MIDKLPISYPALPLGPIEQERPRYVGSPTSMRGATVDRHRQVLRVTAAALIAAVLVLAFALSIQGVGLEDHAGTGPDRPPQTILGAPVHQPDWG